MYSPPTSLISQSHATFIYPTEERQQTVQVYSFIDKCFPNFPNWIAQLNTNSQKYFQPEILNVLFRRHKGQLRSGKGKSCKLPLQILVLETLSFRVGFLNKIL